MARYLKLIYKFSLWGIIPLIIAMAGYLYYDPFKVVRHQAKFDDLRIIPNRDYISTEMFLRNKDKYHYNSFVFGSSITLAFRPETWRKYLQTKDRPFMFDASAESLYGIYEKLCFLDSIHQPIDHALVILDRDGSFADSTIYNGHIFMKDPRTSGAGKLDFQLAFIYAYLHPRFFLSFYTFLFTKSYMPFMANYISRTAINYDPITNEIDLSELDRIVKTDSAKYYDQLKPVFYQRKGETKDGVSRISLRHIRVLTKMKQLLEKHHTEYKVILAPLYDQVKFNDADFSILKQLFPKHLYDFSGKNSFTDLQTNYYEPRHFKPSVGDSIFKVLYKNPD